MNESNLPVFEIRSSSAWRMLDVRELWTYRELAYFLAWRDIKVRYKQTALGIAWAVLQPLAMIAVLTPFFRRLAAPGETIPYPLFALAALIPWQLFSRAISESTHSLVTDQRLITRVYFPRIIVPISTVIAALVDFLISCGLLALFMAIYDMPIRPQVVFIPVFILLLIVAALGVGFWLSALNVEYRDVAHTMPFLNQFWFFITPVVYAVPMMSDRFKAVYGLNPMVGVAEGFRWALFGTGSISSVLVVSSVASALVLFLTGIVWFRRRERTFVDSIGSGGR